MKYLLLVLGIVFFSCKKENTVNGSINDRSDRETLTQPNKANKHLASRLNNGFVNITANANGTYSGNGIIFGSILYRTGTYQTGEAVNSFTVQQYTGTGDMQVYGPAYSIFTPTSGGMNTNFHDDWTKYKAAYDKAMQGLTSPPFIDDYIKNEYTNPSGFVSKGIVVRDLNSPSTFSIAPGSYQPILQTSQSTGPHGILGYTDKTVNNILYHVYFWGYSNTGYIDDVVVEDVNSQNVGVSSFSVSSTMLSPTGYHVVGTVILANGTSLSINDDIDGF